MTKKRAPLNAEIIEGLELIRLNYTGKGDEVRAKALEKDIMTIQNYNEPIFDKVQINNITNISEDVKNPRALRGLRFVFYNNRRLSLRYSLVPVKYSICNA